MVPPAPPTPKPVPEHASWAQRIEALALGGMARQLALNSICTAFEAEALRLTLDVRHKHLLSEDNRRALEAALRQQTGRELHLVVDVGIGSLDTPAAQAEAARDARQKAAEAAIAEDPAVQAFQQHFGASVRAGSIKPV